MTSNRDRFRVELDVDPGSPREPNPRSVPHEQSASSGPFRIALIGDFSGRENRGIVETGRAIAARRPVRIDRDNFDDAIATLAPTLTLRLARDADAVAIGFSSLDDLHPDSLYQRLPLFRALRDAGARAAAGASLGAAATRPTPTGLLDAILGDAPLPPGGAALAAPEVRPALEPDGGLSAFVARAVAGHIVRQPGESELAAQARVDETIAATMRAILHHADFQALEALWRGAALLVSRLDTDATLQLHLIDVSPAELAADLDGRPVDESGIHRLLLGGSTGPWALLAAAFPLGGDSSLLTQLGALARDAGAPLLAGAHPHLAGVQDIGATPDPDDWSRDETPGWQEQRGSSAAPYVGLVFPRLLLRLPYGKHADPCELFAFEELAANAHPAHDDLLWGSGAFAAALLVGEGFVESGWALRPGREIAGLPLHVYRVNGESFATPCAEMIIGERAAERLLDRGLSPLLTVRDSDSVILPRLQPIAARAPALLGRWNKPS